MDLSSVELQAFDEVDRIHYMDFNHNFRKLVVLVTEQRQILPYWARFSNDIDKLTKGSLRYPMPRPDYYGFGKNYG